MFKSLFTALLLGFSFTAHSQQGYFYVSVPQPTTKDYCAERMVQAWIYDTRFPDLNNLTLTANSSILLTGISTLSSYTAFAKDKNGQDYKISVFLDIRKSDQAIDCYIGVAKGKLPLQAKINRIENGSAGYIIREKTFDLRCVAQGKAANCAE